MYPPGRLFFLPPALTSLIEGLGLNQLLAGSGCTMQDARACASVMASGSFLPTRDLAFFDCRSKSIISLHTEHVSPLGGEYRLVPTFGKTNSPDSVAITSAIGNTSFPAPEPIAVPSASTFLPLSYLKPSASSAVQLGIPASITNPASAVVPPLPSATASFPTSAAPPTSVSVITGSSVTPSAAPVASLQMTVASVTVLTNSQHAASDPMANPAVSVPEPVSSAPPSVSQPQGSVFQTTDARTQAPTMAYFPISAPAAASDPLGDIPMAPSILPSRVAIPVPQPGVPVSTRSKPVRPR